MHRLALLILSMATMNVQAKEPDYRSYFTFPDVQVTIDFGDGHAVAIPYKNHSVPTTPSETPIFQFGNGEQGPGYSHRVQWRFIEKTESGDLYLIAVYQKEHLTKEVPVLYTGSSVVAYDRDHISVTLEPPDGAKWKAP